MSRWSIPDTWQWANANDIATIIGGSTPSTKNPANFSERGIPWLTPADLSNFQEEYISRGRRDLSEEGFESCGAHLMPKNTVLFTSRAPIGYCVLSANEICTNQGFKNLVLWSDISPKYVRHYLLSSKQYAESLGSGSTFKELSGKRMATLEIPIPPINEQNRIAARIEELQARSHRAREVLDSIPELIGQLRQSVLAAAFRGDLTKKWREKQTDHVEPASELLKRIRIERRKRWESAELEKLKAKGLTGEKLETAFAKRRKKYKEPAPVDTTDLPELPEGWCWAAIEEISEWVTDGTHQPPPFSERGIPFIVISNMMRGTIRWDTVRKWVSSETYDKFTGKYKPCRGDVIYSTVGSYGVAVEIETDSKFMFQRHIAHIRPISDLFSTTYLAISLNSPSSKKQADKFARGVAQKTINLSDLRHFIIPLAPFNEQKIIAKLLNNFTQNVDDQNAAIESLLAILHNLEESILTKAFQGKLVPQDPSDEPASVLLERIQQEKALAAAKQKTKPKQKGKKMTHQKKPKPDVLSVLRKSTRAMTPEDVFAAASFDESSVDEFYEQLRNAVAEKQIREIRNVDKIELEAIQP